MTSVKYALPLAAILVAATLWFWIFPDSVESTLPSSVAQPTSDPVASTGSAESEASNAAASQSSESTPVVDIKPGALETTRDALEGSARALRVVNPQRAPISEARLFWLAIAEHDRHVEPAWRVSDWGPLERDVVWATSDTEGRFELVPPQSGSPFGSVVGAWHANHQARLYVLEPNVLELPVDEIVLEPAAGFGVLVLDKTGQPAAGVAVAHYGLSGRGEAGYDKLPTDETARRFLVEEAVTDATGRARLSPFPGESVLQAHGDGKVSLPWIGAPSDGVTLLLTDAFEISGKVKLPALEPDEDDERRILIQALRAGSWRDLAQLRGVQEGQWGPVWVPLVEADLFRARFEGWPFVPVAHTFEPPRASAEITADLEVERGLEMWFLVHDERNEPILNSEVTLFWEEEQPRRHETSYPMRASEEGWVRFQGIPPGLFRYEVRAPGFATHSGRWSHTSSFAGYWLSVNLVRAGKLRGKVRSANGVVPDFEVAAWRAGKPENRVRRTFAASSDGSFEMTDVPVGDLLVSARSQDSPGGSVEAVVVPAEGFGEVELVLSDKILGSGRLLDATTLEPVANATVQSGLAGALGDADVFGLPEAVQADGSFEIEAFVPGRCTLIVTAEGFGRTRVVRNSAHGRVQFGNILLEPTQDLTVRLTGFEGIDPTGVLVSRDGSGAAELVAFSASGIATLAETSPGPAKIRLEFPDRPVRFYVIDLRPGEPWELECPLDDSRSLMVAIDTAQDQARAAFERLDTVYIRGTDAQGRDFVLGEGSLEETMVFDGLPIEAGVVELKSADAQIVASAAFDFRGAQTTSVPISLQSRVFRVLVEDGDGRPLENGKVILRDPSRSGFAWSAPTDSSGIAAIVGVPERELLADVTHEERGTDHGQRLDARLDDAQLRFDPTRSMELRLLDGDDPLGGIHVAWIDSSGSRSFRRLRSDLTGRLSIANVGPEPMHLRVDDARVWPSDFHIAASGREQVLAVRRRADLNLLVTAPGGLPVRDLALEIRSVEFDASLQDWQARGLLPASASLATDAEGRLRVPGLPHGSYEWEAVAPDEVTFEGAFELRLDSSEIAVVLQ